MITKDRVCKFIVKQIKQHLSVLSLIRVFFLLFFLLIFFFFFSSVFGVCRETKLQVYCFNWECLAQQNRYRAQWLAAVRERNPSSKIVYDWVKSQFARMGKTVKSLSDHNLSKTIFKLIWLYQISWKCKLATVTSYKADVSSVRPSAERMEGLWVVCGFIWRKWSYAIGWNIVTGKTWIN